MKVFEITDYIQELAPLDSGIINDENGFIFGNKDKTIKKVGVAWMPTLSVLKNAEEKDIDLLIVHEHLFYKKQDSEWYEDSKTENKEINKLKKKILEENNITVYRAHSNWDCLKEFGILDSLADSLELTDAIEKTKFIKTYKINEISLSEFSDYVKGKLNLMKIIVYGKPNEKISRVTLLIGGFGGNQDNMPEVAKKHKSNLLICGDLIEHVLIQARELGLNVIQIGHSTSEIPGVKNLYYLLKKKFPTISLTYFESGIN